jgi:hypothetical protein
MVLLSMIALAICIAFTELSWAFALLVTGFGAIVGCAGLALWCPHKLKDDCLFRADVM